jgi:zinc protease
MQFNIKAGQNREPLGKNGIAYLASKMLQESSYKMSAEEINDALDKVGARVSVNADQEYITVSVHCLTKFFNQTIVVLNEMLMHPRLDPDEFKRVKDETLQLIANQSLRADALAENSFHKLLYGKDHPYGYSIMGTKESVENITLDDMNGFFKYFFTAKNTDLFISGNVDQKQLDIQLMLMAGWPPIDVPPASLPIAPAIEKTKIYLVNKDNAPQSEIRIGYLALPYDATGDFYKDNIMNYPLGGAFSSRLNLFIREQKGYTYGIRSSFDGNHSAGPYVVSAGVRANVTDSSIIDVLDILKKYRDKGITKKELEFTKSALEDREALRYETNVQKARYMERMVEYNLSDNYVNDQLSALKKLKTKDINNLAKKYLPMDNMVIVVVGDANKLRDKLSKLGYDVIDYVDTPMPIKHSGDVPGSIKN